MEPMMSTKIIIDCEYDSNGLPIGYQTVDADPSGEAIHSDPAGSKNLMTSADVLKFMSANPAARQVAGYNEMTKLPGVAPGTTRWQTLLNEAAKPTASAHLKDLKLKA
jgi:hypothetical protein